MVTGWTVLALDAWAAAAAGAAVAIGRSRAPVALNARTVPVAARTADRSEAARSGPAPPVLVSLGRRDRRRRRGHRFVPALGRRAGRLVPGPGPLRAQLRRRRVAFDGRRRGVRGRPEGFAGGPVRGAHRRHGRGRGDVSGRPAGLGAPGTRTRSDAGAGRDQIEDSGAGHAGGAGFVESVAWRRPPPRLLRRTDRWCGAGSRHPVRTAGSDRAADLRA